MRWVVQWREHNRNEREKNHKIKSCLEYDRTVFTYARSIRTPCYYGQFSGWLNHIISLISTFNVLKGNGVLFLPSSKEKTNNNDNNVKSRYRPITTSKCAPSFNLWFPRRKTNHSP